jgi:hypothetical protein
MKIYDQVAKMLLIKNQKIYDESSKTIRNEFFYSNASLSPDNLHNMHSHWYSTCSKIVINLLFNKFQGLLN